MKEVHKNSPLDILTITAGLVMSLLFGCVFYILLVYIILPLATELISPLYAWLTGIGRRYDVERIYKTIYGFCALLSLFPSTAAANISVKGRRRRFIHDTNGMISRRDGIRYHMKNHLVFDVMAIAATVGVGFALSYVDFYFFRFPFDVLYEYLGIPLGLAASAVLTAAAQFFGVLRAQEAWRADHFLGE